MHIAPLPANETERLAALARYNILDTPLEQAFDDLAVLAAQICGVPIALVTLIDAERQWFKTSYGIEGIHETSRDVAFCAHTILHDDVMIVPDAYSDERFADNPLVTEAPHVRFYAGMPLITDDGYALGSLCVLDQSPRVLSSEQIDVLRRLGRQVQLLLELRGKRSENATLLQQLAAQHESLEKMIASVPGIVWEHWIEPDPSQYRTTYISKYLETMLGYTCEDWEASPVFWQQSIHKDDIERLLKEVNALYTDSREGLLHFRMVTAHGQTLWVEAHCAVITDSDGKALGMRTVMMDVSTRIQAEEARAQLQQQIIEAQELALQELSTPLIPLSKDTLVMPLIGTLDTRRMQDALEVLLEGVAHSKALAVILDITGVPVIDTHVAQSLVRSAQAVQLLGSQLVLTGIRPEVAQMLVSLGIELSGIVTHSSLQSGIEYALTRQSSRSQKPYKVGGKGL